MHFAIPKGIPPKMHEKPVIAPGGLMITGLFLLTILMTICLHHYISIPSCVGMMTGLAFLQFFGYYLKKKNHLRFRNKTQDINHFDVFSKIQRIEWDTLLFFYGVLLCISGLAAFGYLHLASTVMYDQWGAHFSQIHHHTPANITIGILSAFIDNIPLMFAVLTINPAMSDGQWLLITLTTGVGGSLLSVGSAAGVALMGQSRGMYTFLSHIKWTWAIAIGYFASIATHLILNRGLF
jgi:Na+/H+ antiporter NhaD/arsenite permease-like protein